MRGHTARLGPEIDRLVETWPRGRPFRFYAAAKEAALRVGDAAFLGLPPDDPEAAWMNRALVAQVEGAVGVVRRPLPFTAMRRGVRAREALSRRLRRLVAERRERGGEDFFSRLCRARDEDGRGWSDDGIVDHFNFLLMAAHDTTATTLTALVWALAGHPERQERVAAEVGGLPRPLDEAALAGMAATERALREALRLVPPVPFVPRRAARCGASSGADSTCQRARS